MNKKLQGRVPLAVLFPVIGGGVLLGVPLRCLQLMRIVEENTGFYTQTHWSIPVLYTVVALACAACLAAAYLARELPGWPAGPKRNPVIGGGAAAAAFGLFLDFIHTIISVYSVFANAEFSSASRMTYFVTSGVFPRILQALFAALGCLYFLTAAFTLFGGKVEYRHFRLLAVTPVLWAACRLMVYFMANTIHYLKVSELLLEMFMLCFLMVALLSLARILSGVGEAGKMRSLYGFSGAAALLFFIPWIARIITAGKYPVYQGLDWLTVGTDFLLFLFLGIFLVYNIFTLEKESKTVS